MLGTSVSQLCFVHQTKHAIVDPDTTLRSISYFLLLINILWSMAYRWAVKEVERLKNNKIMLGH